MTTKVPTEILIKILDKVQSSRSTQDLFSSLLVNRIWCKVTIPLLWGLPLGQEYRCTDDIKLRKTALCIRTYISCMDTQARNLLTQNGFDLSSSPPQTTFDYPSFIHKFIISNLVYYISIYSPQIIVSDNFELTDVPINISDGDLVVSILKLPGALKTFKKLEKLLTKLISVQKWLENLTIIGGSNQDCNSLLWAIINQKETLKSLRLISVNFISFKEKSSPIGQFISLQELYIEDCHGLYKSECLSWASSFPQLSSIHFNFRYESDIPQKFIIKILQTANKNLRNIGLNLYSPITFDIFSAILNYCTKITKLSLQNLNPEHVIAIFNNSFNELRSFSFDCGWEEFDANELLCQMAENVPESLKTIIIKMGYHDPWTFSADNLRKFFEGWGCKGGELNKKIIVRRRGLHSFKLSDEHFKVIEEYGVQFNLEGLYYK
ncbi:6904_t:CDS:2 [Diversispora eburnea]|uniref:6904_t:CDS:1 n=1 Tax=Diversispora eburnea TaxID=1213867 RepID=A0A9N9AKV6_9GLOM|nr:6904_t:CDS:2 [Diversispora eburnea]